MNYSSGALGNTSMKNDLTKGLWIIIPPIFIIVGTIGNTCSIIVLTRPKIIKSTSALYLIILAFSDTLVLYTGLLRHWLEHAFKWNVRHQSEAACKLHVYITYLFLDFSAWLLVAVTIDRLVLVWFPHKARTKCTKSAVCVIISIIFVVFLTFNSHLLYGNKLVNHKENNVTKSVECGYIDKNYEMFFAVTWPWMDFAIFSLIPFFVLLIGNILICVKLLSWRKNRRTSNNPGCHASPLSSITLMLFTLNTVFLISTTPISIYNITCKDFVASSPYQKLINDLMWSVCNILMYVNNTFNFLLYIFSGSRFRSEAKALIRDCVRRKNGTSSIRLKHITYGINQNIDQV